MAKKYEGVPQDEEALTGATAHVNGTEAEGGNKATDDQPEPVEKSQRSFYLLMIALFSICIIIVIASVSFELYAGKIGCKLNNKSHPSSPTPTLTTTAQPLTTSTPMASSPSTTNPPPLNYSLIITESGLCLTGGIDAFADICRGDGDQLWALHQGLLLNERTGECLAGDGMKRKLRLLHSRTACAAPNHCVWHHRNGKVGCGRRCLDEGNTYAGLPVVLRPCWEANHWVIG